MTSNTWPLPSPHAASEQALPEERCIEQSRSGNGYVREPAVRQLAGFTSAAALRATIERLNDWVPQVRNAAAQSLQAFMNEERLSALLECLDPLVSLERKTRANHRANLAMLAELLSREKAKPRVEYAFARSTRHSARFLFRVLNKNARGSQDSFFMLAARHRDISIRIATVAALRRFTDEHATRMLTNLLNDPHGKVRCEALRELWKRSPPPSGNIGLAQIGLLDPAESIRIFTRTKAAREGIDIEGLLAGWIADESVRTSRLAGLLGLIGSLEFAKGMSLVKTSIAHPHAPVRSAALSAWIRLAPGSAGEAASALLGGSSNKVAHKVHRYVTRGEISLTETQFAAAIENALRQRKFRRALSIVNLLPFWHRLDALLCCLDHANAPAGIGMIEASLDAWQEQLSKHAMEIGEITRERIHGGLTRLSRGNTSRTTERLCKALTSALSMATREKGMNL